MSASGPIPEIPEHNFTEGFRDPDEAAAWWLLNFYLEVPFYFPYLGGATFNIDLHQEKWAAPVPAEVPEPPFVLLEVIQSGVPPPIEPSPAMRRIMRNLLHDRAKGDLRSAFDVFPVDSHPQVASVVEAITPKVLLQSEVEAGQPHHPGTYLSRCLDALNVWIRSLAFLTLEPSIRTIQAENLPQYMAFFHQRPHDGEIVRFDFFRSHENPALSRNTFATQSLAEQVRLIASSVDDSHGVFKSKEWFHTSMRLSTVEGRHDLAMVALNTAVEVLVFGLARLLLVDEGVPLQEIDAAFAGRMGVQTVCHRYIEPRIGGRWDVSDSSCPIGEVAATIFEVRNKVAHQGLHVSPRQVGAGLTTYINFTTFLVRRTAANRWQYTRTCMDLLNAYGHPADVTVGGRFDRAARNVVKATPKYWLSRDDPRHQSLPQVIVQAFPGNLPAAISEEKKAHWATTGEFFMHWVVRAARSTDLGRADPESTK